MSFESLIATYARLGASMEALAALGAELRLRRDGKAGDPQLRRLLHEVVQGISPQLLEGVDPSQEAIALATIQAFFRQAADLLENPARPPGWIYEDPTVLQAQGQASRMVVRGLESFASTRPTFAETLRRPGAFLDVGTGVGLLAIEAARAWPQLRVVGIDPWEPALALAKRNVAESGMAARVELRAQRIETCEDRDAFTLAWLPGPFLAPEIVKPALERTRRSLQPGGWIVFALYAPAPDPLGQALAALRVVRSGGHPWTTQEIEELLRSLKFEQIESFPVGIVLLVVGRRPTTPNG